MDSKDINKRIRVKVTAFLSEPALTIQHNPRLFWDNRTSRVSVHCIGVLTPAVVIVLDFRC